MPPKAYHYGYFTSSYNDYFTSPYNDYVHYTGRADQPFYYERPPQRPYESPRLKKGKPRYSYGKPSSDRLFYTNEQSNQSRARQTFTTTRSPQKVAKATREATDEDAIRAGIPLGYSIKNWDPVEKPIILLGSVFDANSLGKWIYDWTMYSYGESTPMADVAGDLWLLLIKLAGKIKRAEDCVERIRSIDSQEMVEDFIDRGRTLWQKFKKLLKACERYMWQAARRKGVSMEVSAGINFVESFFGRDLKLEKTEKLMNSMRLWNLRFDANCEEIIKNPRHGTKY